MLVNVSWLDSALNKIIEVFKRKSIPKVGQVVFYKYLQVFVNIT